MKKAITEDGGLTHASVRERIVQLALVENQRRMATYPGEIATVFRREQRIMVALHRDGRALNSPHIAHVSEPATAVCSANEAVAKECR